MSHTQDTRGVFDSVRTELNFPADEARVLKLWQERRIFDKTLRAETRHTGPSKGIYVFYEGPPTANGMPHNGHVLTRAVKDVLPRYKTMCGYDVPRKAGWDTHGLPVEVEVEKELGIHGKADIEHYGMEPFIARCIESVFRYTDAWEKLTHKIGFWVDLPSAYVTYHRSYVESVWWALSVLHAKKLLYRGHRVCWWWPQGGTALSAAEVGWNYKTVDDPSLYVAFPLVDEPQTALCVWTTTPWTLPSNGYAAVKPDVDYVVVDSAPGRKLIVAAALRESLAKKLGRELPVVKTMRGAELCGLRYRPPFDAFSAELFDREAPLRDGGAVPMYWRVFAADFVTLDTGTGIVHVAPAFGEDDHLAHRAELARYAAPDEVPLICAVDGAGRFTDAMPQFAGMGVKEADPQITANLRDRGLLVHVEQYRHDYPYCWRADDDPLIQLARPAWYIRTTAEIQRAIANNQAVRWFPEHIKDGRFGDFLANNVDWALSRERFWGTPLNVWICEADESHELAPDSVAAIERLNPEAFRKFYAAREADPSLNEHLIVHKPWIDHVTLPCPQCGATMRRAPEVIDAWFDSGSMPFAQVGFPHLEGSKERFEATFPADFISEAIDQTRGWFYSLLMISTLVFDEQTLGDLGLRPRELPHPYRNCVVLGHVCDREGKKESKSKGNYTPPEVILERVRMPFAVIPADSSELARLKGKLPAEEGVVYVARADYEGLDLVGESTDVVLYRSDREATPRHMQLKPAPVRGLPRRVVVVAEEDRRALEIDSCSEGLAIKPNDVPALPVHERVMIEDPSRPAPGADAFRWFFYAASPPWTNTRHSLTNVRLMQKDFVIKLRNVYSFFTIYANIDRFDPADGNRSATGTEAAELSRSVGYRPVAERVRLDRWMLSELHLAVRDVRRSLDRYGLYEAAQRLFDLVDALSNWYVRRSRARFWASASDAEVVQAKRDATFTLYEVLVTTAKLIAPFVPFFAEEMYQNLVCKPWPTTQPESVHLCAYPEPDEAVMDERLSAEMRLARELVHLGLQVRTDNKLRVRQPLARADVVVSSEELSERMKAFDELVVEELNVHEIRWLRPGQEGGAVRYELKPNFRALGPRLGKKVQLVKKELARANAGDLRAELASTGAVVLDVAGERIELGPDEVDVAVVAAEGYAAAGGRAGVVVLHTALDESLLDEGLAREILARVQAIRKELNLGYTDTITVQVQGGDRIQQVVAAHREHLSREALCSDLTAAAVAEEPAADGGVARVVTIQGEEVVLVVRPS
ncbi:MAG: isoleucine--tRNA ligase [Deltaproteobacteria bacterium]|jgi:isoleucyl-tRNA synthetase|nr:isoleucine--tRNA ligase [Deltaproteobacteria bacterium]MBW2534920.1 isoleucine--tRNA ligase [Deltaproteobacteria bacterium]